MCNFQHYKRPHASPADVSGVIGCAGNARKKNTVEALGGFAMRSARFAVAALALILAIPATRAQSNRPNILFILADDLGYETIAANGGTSYATPNLDRLAASGIRF